MEESVVSVQVSLYGLEAIYKACYSFLDRAYIRLEGDPQGAVTVRLNPKPDVTASDWKGIAGELENELIHHALRAKIAASNQKIREFIVTRALASAEGAISSPGPSNQPPAMDEELEKEIEKLLSEVEKQADGDPLGIVAPWEQKETVKPKK